MVPYDADYDVAIDSLAIYSGTLGRVIDRLENTADERPEEIAAYRQELAKVNAELQTMGPDDPELVNRANYIYTRLSRSLVRDYLETEPRA